MRVLLLTCFTACVLSLSASARSLDNGRHVLQAQTGCPAGCATDSCILGSTDGTFKCTLCQNNLILNSDGACSCPEGYFISSGPSCAVCPKGSYCPGGTFTGGSSPDKTVCPSSMTTRGQGARDVRACVNTAGNFFVEGSPPSQTTCPKDTYSPGLRKQRACVPCPPGYTTNDATGKTASSDCLVPKGYFVRAPGQIAPCPRGEYKDTLTAVATCTPCGTGVTTVSEGSTANTDCKVLLPKYWAPSYSGTGSGPITGAQFCKQDFFCPGGTISAETKGATPCDKGLWTQGIGAQSASECLIPPGYFLDGTTNLVECQLGEYREGWSATADKCMSCGTDIPSEPNDQIARYDPTTNQETNAVNVRGNPAACYIEPGQGMYMTDPTASPPKYRAVNCLVDKYGAAKKIPGLAVYPCRDCPAGMKTDSALASTTQYWAAGKGATDPLACVTKSGYGYNGRTANLCPAGSYNTGGNRDPCTQCTGGLTNIVKGSDAATSCKVPPGSGWIGNQVVSCPVGTSRDLPYADTTNGDVTCPVCSGGTTTAEIGQRTCTYCKPGFGGAACDACGGTQPTYAAGVREAANADSACLTCPSMNPGYNFWYSTGGKNEYIPATVAPAQAKGTSECVALFAQHADNWFLAGASTTEYTSTQTMTLTVCADGCRDIAGCQFVTYDYSNDKCYHRMTTVTDGSVLAFKTVLVDGSTATSSSFNATRAKAITSGIYSFWKDNGAGIGSQTDVSPNPTVKQCLQTCDQDEACAGVVMSSVTSTTTDTTAVPCKLIKGSVTVGDSKRSMVKAALGAAFTWETAKPV